MKKLYQINLLAVGLLLCHTLTVAQSNKLDQIRLSGTKLKEVSDTLQLDMQLSVGGVKLRTMEQITVTPKLMGVAGNYCELPSFVIAGKMRQRYNSRSALLNRKQPPKYSSEYSYSQWIPFAEWMQYAQLVLVGLTTGCGNTPPVISARTITAKVDITPRTAPASYVMTPFVNYIMPQAEPIKNRTATGSAKIEFPAGQSAILPTYKGNQAELDKINLAIRQVLGDTLATVNSILLTAFSSPEGSYAANERLSIARAAALKTYIEANNNLRGITVNTKAVAEDWGGLETMIEQSSLPEKQLLLATIANNANPDMREQRLRAIDGGRVWQAMVRDWFAALRRTDYQLNYSVRDFTVEQGRQIIKTRPAQMSLGEMFSVANSYAEGSPEFNEVFDIAVRLFPDNPIANINAAAAAIKQGNAAPALKYLERAGNDPQSANNRAAYYMLIDNLTRAKECLLAAPQNIEAVKQNQQQIITKQQNNALIEQFTQKQSKQ